MSSHWRIIPQVWHVRRTRETASHGSRACQVGRDYHNYHDNCDFLGNGDDGAHDYDRDGYCLPYYLYDLEPIFMIHAQVFHGRGDSGIPGAF